MGFQVFPEPTPATDFETLGINISQTSNSDVPTAAINFNGTAYNDYAATTTVTAGVYLANYTMTGAVTGQNQFMFAGATTTNIATFSGSVTSGTSILIVSTTETSFRARLRASHANNGNFFTTGGTVTVRGIFIPDDSRPVIFAGGNPTSPADGNNYNQISISTDGVSFTGRNIIPTTGSTTVFQTAWHDGTNFYAIPQVNSNFIWWSTNGGVNWTTRATAVPTLSGSIGNLYNGYYDPVVGRHYIYDSAGTVSYTSTNGVNWSSFTSGWATSTPTYMIRAGSFLFLMGIQNSGDSGGSLSKITVSTNGINWATPTISNGTTNDPITRIAANTVTGQYVAVSAQGGIWLSTNITNWNRVRAQQGNGTEFNLGLLFVAFGDGMWVAGGGNPIQDSRSFVTSTDAVNWTNVGGTASVSQGISSSASTFSYYIGAIFATTNRASRWVFYSMAASSNTLSAFSGMSNVRATVVSNHPSPFGRPVTGFTAGLERFKMNRNSI